MTQGTLKSCITCAIDLPVHLFYANDSHCMGCRKEINKAAQAKRVADKAARQGLAGEVAALTKRLDLVTSRLDALTKRVLRIPAIAEEDFTPPAPETATETEDVLAQHGAFADVTNE